MEKKDDRHRAQPKAGSAENENIGADWQGSWGRLIAKIGLPITIGFTAVFVILLYPLVLRANPPAMPTVLPDIIRTALAAGAGFGAVATLIIAGRRQWLSEDTANKSYTNEIAQRAQRERIATQEQADRQEANRIAEHDAEERRLTEMFGRAAEQLGHDKAPVRIAGIYALERLADRNESQQAVVLNVVLAYLRMPYTPPGDAPTEDAPPARRTIWLESANELNVRETAERLLHRHRTRTVASRFWAADEIDLTGASLLGLDFAEGDLSNARMGHAVLGGAKFHRANLSGARLIFADLGASNLREAQLDNAILAAADLRNADLRRSNLVDADLEGADLRYASLDGADVSGADLRMRRFENLTVADLRWSSDTKWNPGLADEIRQNSIEDVTRESTSTVQFWVVRATFKPSDRAY